jgi:hypothetical protein
MTALDARRAAARHLHDAFVTARGEQWLRFEGHSMAPMLRPGDLLSVRQVTAHELARGDIVVFARGDANVVHRLLAAPRFDEPLRTKGDNTWRVDPPVAPSRLIGKVCTVRRGRVRIDLDRGRWRAVSRAIARASLLEARAAASVAALRRRWLPAGRGRRSVERRILRLLAGCRRVLVGALLRTVPPGDAR